MKEKLKSCSCFIVFGIGVAILVYGLNAPTDRDPNQPEETVVQEETPGLTRRVMDLEREIKLMRVFVNELRTLEPPGPERMAAPQIVPEFQIMERSWE